MPARLLPIGKLPADILKRLLSGQASPDPSVIIGPGLGFDCAVVDPDPELLVIKSDPVTFVSDMIGWYAVQVNANDIATTGARPRWFTAPDDDADKVRLALQNAAIPCAVIGEVAAGPPQVVLAEDSPADIPSGGPRPLPWPARDDLAKAFAAKDS